MVRKERLELSRLATLVPKTSASTNSATFAFLTKPLPAITAKSGDYTWQINACV